MKWVNLGFMACTILLVILLFADDSRPGQTAEELYNSARDEYRNAFGIAEKDKKIEALRRCIQKLEEVDKSDTQGSLAPKRLYLTGQCYHLIYDAGKKQEDREAALQHYRQLVEKYPESQLADDAQYLKGVILMPDDPTQALVELKKVSLFFPGGDSKPKAVQMAAQLERQLGCKDNPKKTADTSLPQVAVSPSLTADPGSPSDPAPGSKADGAKGRTSKKADAAADKSGTKCPAVAELQNIQHWTGEDYTRVALYTSTPVAFQEQAYLQDPKHQKPAQILVDLKGCAVNPRLGSHQKIDDAFLEGINAVQLDPSKARIILDAKSLDRYRIFTLSDPFRIIVDIQGKKTAQQVAGPPSRPSPPASAPASPSPPTPPSPLPTQPTKDRLPSLARQLGLEVNRVVLDPGHGGKDKGATGPGGVHEKNITLAIALELKDLIEEKLNCQVLLTRTKDRFVSLEERTAFANTHKADLFISIHTNANEDKNQTGTETYYLNFSKDKESARVAALENATSTKRISDLETILHDLMRNTKIKESSQLATAIHRQVVKHIKAKEQERVRDLGVKQAPFCVLIGAEMPCILIETAFITNPKEEARLKDKDFQKELAKGITAGLDAYMKQMKSLARAEDRP